MNAVITKIKEILEGLGILVILDEDPNKLFVAYELEGGQEFALMMTYSPEAHMMFIVADVPVEIAPEKEEEALLSAAYINQILKVGSSTYWQEINRIVFKFYIGIDSSDDEYNLDMFMYCYYEAIDLVRRFYPILDLVGKGAIPPEDIVAMESDD